MHRKAAATAAADHPRTGSCSEQEIREDTIDDRMNEEDGEFKLNPWLCALHLLGLGSGSALQWPISSIKARSTTERVPQVVGIVNSCTPNGLGDLIVTLKDPTGTIGASIHRRVLKECSLPGDISVGCVLLLKQIVVFSAGCSACYLNVTPNNLVKLINKDSGPPLKQIVPSLAVRRDPSAERAFFVRQRAENAGDDVGRNLINGRIISEKRGLTGSSTCSIKTAVTTNNTAVNIRPDMQVGLGAPEEVNLVGQRDVSAADEVRSNLNYASTRNSAEHIETELRAIERGRSVRPRVETITDEARGDLNYETMNNGKEGRTGGISCSINNAAARTNMATNLKTSDGMEIELVTADKEPLVRLRANTNVAENISCDTIISNCKAKLNGSFPSSIKAAAATGNMAAVPNLTREQMETELGNGNETTADNVARTNLSCGRMVTGQKTNPTGRLPGSISAMVIATDTGAEPEHRTSEPKKLISKVSVTQWTDEQLAELFSDYQDDAY